jgi:hypothetical protein
MMNTLEFQATIKIRGINPYVDVTADQAAVIRPEWRRPMPVLVQVNGKPAIPWHINMMPTGTGDFYLYLHNDIRHVSQTKVGDTVALKVWFDEEYRNGPLHPMPGWFRAALDQNQVATVNWGKLPPSRQKEVLRYFDGLKSDEAKQRNVERAIYVLEGNTGRFMGREWVDGR